MIKRVTVFCASSERIDKYYSNEAYRLGNMLAENGIEVIYGGGKRGLMGALSDGVLDAGGKIIGVIPKFMENLELGRKDIYELRVVKDMHKRVSMLIKDSDMLIALPGGVGTFDELMQAIAWKTLGLIIKPILIVNTNNFFEYIIKSLQRAEEENFMHVSNKNLWKEVTALESVINEINKTNDKSHTFNFSGGKIWSDM